MQDDEDFIYSIYIRTGTIIKGGTDSVTSLTLYDAGGQYVNISSLEAWGGLIGEGYNYFERGNLDIFSGRGRCMNAPVCDRHPYPLYIRSSCSRWSNGWCSMLYPSTSLLLGTVAPLSLKLIVKDLKYRSSSSRGL
ncbi:protein SCO1-like protein 2 [Hibiscus syriacus]|uniref:Protein SCO1-like protein 2 n=1 Tax=Hibiscus syriacus TaxID=106335 RepID=A0A6A3BGD5_HIBSY|nr:protein SCO1-like protein 2 [Hibiscus syriacus]